MQDADLKLVQNFRSPSFPSSYFISFEGIEGSGKTTQILKFKDYLESKTYRVLTFREPGGTPYGEKLRSAILESKNEISPLAEGLLFASSRAQLFHEIILRELEIPNTIIICDRFFDSSVAYQGHARGLGINAVMEMHQHFPLNLLPHVTYYLKIDLETSLYRQQMRKNPKDYFESRNHDFHQDLINGYDHCASLFPQRIHVVDGSKDQDDVKSDIIHHFDQLFDT